MFYLRHRSAVVLFSVLSAVVLPVVVSAHPHVFVDARITFQFSDTEFEGVWAEWEFDELFTAMIVVDFDAPRSGPFPPGVIRGIQDGAFSNLQYYDYFTYIFADGRRHATERVEQFTAFMRDHRVVYRFFIPFRYEIGNDPRTIRVRMTDETFFTDIAFDQERPVRVDSARPMAHETRVFRNEGVAIEYDATNQSVRRDGMLYTGLTFPWEAEVRFRRP